MKNPMQKAFKAPPKRGAFGSSGKSPFGSDSSSSIDRDMWANMEPVDIDEAPWWTQISFGQVVRADQITPAGTTDRESGDRDGGLVRAGHCHQLSAHHRAHVGNNMGDC